MNEGGDATNRRAQGDRREGGANEGRRGAKRGTSPLMYVLRALGLVVVLVGTIVFTVRNTRPIYTGKGKLAEELRKRAPEAATVLSPSDSSRLDRLLATEEFRDEKRKFFEDVMRLKQVDSARADSIAHYAIREAYIRGISPAIIFGVMLTENSRFISNAKSNVGAVGLMQVYPKIWAKPQYTSKLGHNLAADSTNVKFGVFILSTYFRPRDKKGEVRERDWQTALLRYNGCVRGTNTPRCHTYPDKVQSFVENQATSICNGRSFYQCIAKPFIEGLFGDPSEQDAIAKAYGEKPDSVSTTVSAGDVVAPSTTATPPPAASAPTPTSPTTTVALAGAPVVRIPPVVVSAPDNAAAPAAPVTPAAKPAAKAAAKPAAKKPVAKPAARKAPVRKATAKAPVKRTTARKPAAKKPAPKKAAAPLRAPKAPTLNVRVP